MTASDIVLSVIWGLLMAAAALALALALASYIRIEISNARTRRATTLPQVLAARLAKADSGSCACDTCHQLDDDQAVGIRPGDLALWEHELTGRAT